jgi:sarcosine oxidase
VFERTADVVVVGAGVMGSATAWRLARRGVSVVLLEQFEPGHVRGSSHGGSRIFRFAYPDDHYVRLAMQALELWRELEDESGEELLQMTGGLDHGGPADISAVADALEGAGRTVERLDPKQAEQRWPAFRFDEAVVFSPDTGRIRADASVTTMQQRARALGADALFDTEVARIDPTNSSVALADGTSIGARQAIVVTAGAWVAELVEPTGYVLPSLRVTREQVFHFQPNDTDGDMTEWPSFIHYGDPARYGLHTPGEGIKVAEHGTGDETSADGRSFDINEVARRRVINYVREWLPGLDPTPTSETTCLYTTTPDAAFVLDRHGDVVIGSPCSGHGFKFAPAIGERLCQLAIGGRPVR